MISSKKINFIAIMLTALVLVGIISVMIFPASSVTGKSIGEFTYGDSHKINISSDDYYSTYSSDGVSKINLKGESAETNSKNVEINDSEITILGGGTYVVSGTLDNGTIIVDATDGTEVRLVLNNAQISSSDFSAIYVKQAKKTIISLAPNSANTLSDGKTYNEEKLVDNKPKAAIYSKDDLVINGSGSLTINANYNDAIKSNDTLKILESKIIINSVDDGINANDYIAMLDANLSITSNGDSIKCENEDEEKGFIVSKNSSFKIISEADGIFSSSSIYADDSSAEIKTGGGSGESSNGMGRFKSSSTDDVSTKGIKAKSNIVINNGSYYINSKDDSIHCDGDVTVNNGEFTISSGDDAVHAGLNLVLNPKKMNVEKCYEGLEGAYITINGGEIEIISSDDGINATGVNSSGGRPGMMGKNTEEKTDEEDIWLAVNGGHIKIETSGDGFDSNGSAVVNDGYLEIYGPENGGNGSIDVGDGGYVLIMNGGSILAVGNSGMAEHPCESSKLKTIAFYLEETYSSGKTVLIKDSKGTEIKSGVSNKEFNWVLVSASEITEGETYTLYVDDKEVGSIKSEDNYSQYGTKSNDRGGGMQSPPDFMGERRDNQ